MWPARFIKILSALSFFLLISCGGGSTQTAGIGGTGITSNGSVSGFGSIFVNGVEYDTPPSTIVTINGVNSLISDLKLGMIVTVRGNLDQGGTTGTANSVKVQIETTGPITGIPIYDANADTKTFDILGQVVIVSAVGTIFDGTGYDFTSINKDDVIQASGYLDNNGALRATHVEKTGTLFLGTTTVEVKGKFGNRLGPSSFELITGIKTLTINHSGSTDFNDLTGNIGTITTGAELEIKGTLTATNEISASKISNRTINLTNNDTNIEIQGYITNYVNKSDFSVNGQRVNAGTAILNPVGLVLGNNVLVKIKGTQVNSVLVAGELESRTGQIKIHAVVSSIINASNNKLSFGYGPGQNIEVTFDNQSQMEDELLQLKPFTVQDISDGDYFELEGISYNGTDVIVKEAHRKISNPNGTSILKGTVTSIDTSTPGAETVTILGNTGIVYATDAMTTFQIMNANTTRQNFFMQLKAGDVVEIKDRRINGVNDGVADEIDIK